MQPLDGKQLSAAVHTIVYVIFSLPLRRLITANSVSRCLLSGSETIEYSPRTKIGMTTILEFEHTPFWAGPNEALLIPLNKP